jgi:hypothetical protein
MHRRGGFIMRTLQWSTNDFSPVMGRHGRAQASRRHIEERWLRHHLSGQTARRIFRSDLLLHYRLIRRRAARRALAP